LERRLFLLISLFLARRLSINFVGNVEERISGVSSVPVEAKEATPIALGGAGEPGFTGVR
jgi:hypothetical protein